MEQIGKVFDHCNQKYLLEMKVIFILFEVLNFIPTTFSKSQ